MTENLQEAADSISALLDTLFPDNVGLRDINRPGDGVFLVGPSHVLPSLTTEQERVRSRLGGDFDHFVAVVRAMLRCQPESVQTSLAQAEEAARGVVELSLTYEASTDAAKDRAREALAELLSLLSNLHDDAEGDTLLVPDTNALIKCTALESWTFEGLGAFRLVLVPSVLAELDELKITHRNPEVRDKAESLIRRIKEFRRRGRLTEGVPVVRGRISLQAVAVEPDVDASLPWLDSANADDRILASCVEVMRMHPRAAVIVVTSDINLQNKTEFAHIPFLEPPGSA